MKKEIEKAELKLKKLKEQEKKEELKLKEQKVTEEAKKEVKVDVPIPEDDDKPLPKWFRFKAKKEYKKSRIKELMVEYDAFSKITDDHDLTETDRYDYMKDLTNLNIKQLTQIGKFQEAKSKYTWMDKWHKLDVKNSMIIRVYYKNNSSTDYLIAKHTRILKIGKFSYIFPPNKGIFDNKHRKTCYAYYQNNPFPIDFSDDFVTGDNKGNTFPDAELLEKTLAFEYAQKLAASEMTKKMDLTLIFCAITMIICAITLLISVKGFDLI